MLFSADAWEGIADGSVTVTFRTWDRRRVLPGRTYRTPAGVIRVDAVRRVPASDITDADAAAAGMDRDVLVRRLGVAPDGEVWRIDFHHEGADPRIALREQRPTEEEVTAIVARLDAIDTRSRSGAWTRDVLASIAARPAVRAPDLATDHGLDTVTFKRRVRRLKELGLTESLRIGYRLSPRGRDVLDHLEQAP